MTYPDRADAGNALDRAGRHPHQVAPSTPGGVQPHRPADPRLFDGGGLPMQHGVMRDDAWARLGPQTRQRLQQLAGTSIEWWADIDESRPQSRPSGYVLGDQGFAAAEPVFDARGRPVYKVSCYGLDPASYRHVTVDWRPGNHAATHFSTHDRATTRPPAGNPPPLVVHGIDRPEQRMIGSMPPRSQQLLLDPFVDSGEDVLRCQLYYEGTVDTLDMFVVVLAGRRTMTAATGTRFTPAGHPESASHWSLVCRRAAVVRRTGR